jgi:hypothetical protein
VGLQFQLFFRPLEILLISLELSGFCFGLYLACGGRLICGWMLFMVTTIGLLHLWYSSQVKPGESEKKKFRPKCVDFSG